MVVAILHYHLQRGGVTKVIEGQCAALRDAEIPHLVLAGSSYDGAENLPVTVIPELSYRPIDDGSSSADLETSLRSAVHQKHPTDDIIWHIHNPTLGKNVLMAPLIRSLSESQDALLLHFHDFAEDHRPSNYQLLAANKELYPVAPQIAYAFINARDRNFLLQAGLPENQSALLPNPIRPSSLPASTPRLNSPLVLYPVRGIQRKNLGEMCLLASLAPAGARFATTLAPENPHWRPIHDRWVQFARDQNLPLTLGAVDHLPPRLGVDPTFENWLQHATHLLTTSIAEGFGMAFLEPLALEKPLLGRNLPEITSDFSKHPNDLGNLYQRLLVPAAWVDSDKLASMMQRRLDIAYQNYQRSCSEEVMQRCQDALQIDQHYDFGNLPEAIQEEVILKAQEHPQHLLVQQGTARTSLFEWLRDALSNNAPADASILDRYSLANYRDRLVATYQRLQGQSPRSPSWLAPARVLDQFLAPERFHFLRS